LSPHDLLSKPTIHPRSRGREQRARFEGLGNVTERGASHSRRSTAMRRFVMPHLRRIHSTTTIDALTEREQHPRPLLVPSIRITRCVRVCASYRDLDTNQPSMIVLLHGRVCAAAVVTLPPAPPMHSLKSHTPSQMPRPGASTDKKYTFCDRAPWQPGSLLCMIDPQ